MSRKGVIDQGCSASANHNDMYMAESLYLMERLIAWRHFLINRKVASLTPLAEASIYVGRKACSTKTTKAIAIVLSFVHS
jgi:hypothetical protein